MSMVPSSLAMKMTPGRVGDHRPLHTFVLALGDVTNGAAE